MRRAPLVLGFTLLIALPVPVATAKPNPVYMKDVEFALKELMKDAGHLFKQKGIDWTAVSREMLKAAAASKSVEDHRVVLTRIIARARGGHAYVKLLPKAGKLTWPLAAENPQAGPGMFWCRSGGKIYVKNAWSAAESVGITPGMQVVSIDKIPVSKWLDAKITERGGTMSFSTEGQALYAAFHRGLARDRGALMKVELITPEGKRKTANLTIRRAGTVPGGPEIRPKDLQQTGRQSFGKTAGGFGYIHLRDAKGSLPTQMDEMQAGIGDVPGLILDCRANGGGAFDHSGFFARFVPKGMTFDVPGAGPNPYPGNVVVIGDSATAGMSSSKKDVTLPSGLFLLHYSIRSNGRNYNKGRGIECIGIPPHELVEHDPKDLAAGVDPMIRRSEELLAKFPTKKLRSRPPK